MCFKYAELLGPPIVRAAYSDRTAWLLAEMSRFAYWKFEGNDDEKNKLKTAVAKAGFDLLATFNEKGTQAFLVKREKDKIAVLAFRGTEQNELDNILTNLDARFYKNEDGAKSHKGFQEAFKIVEAEIRKECKKIKDCALYVSGHSLGGALALIATKALNSDNLAACYTYGSPKVGNAEFGDSIKAPIYRVVNALDVVPTLPFTRILDGLHFLFRILKIKRIQDLVQKFRGYAHHGDLRFLTDCAGSYDEVRVINNYSEVKRSIRLFIASKRDRGIGVKCHSLDEYCEKLAQYALKRNEIS